MNELLFCSTVKLLEMLVERVLPILVEHLITELIKESINQANKHPKTDCIKK